MVERIELRLKKVLLHNELQSDQLLQSGNGTYTRMLFPASLRREFKINRIRSRLLERLAI